MKKNSTFFILLSIFVVRVVGASYQYVREPTKMTQSQFSIGGLDNPKAYPSQVIMTFTGLRGAAVIQGHCDLLNDTSTSPLEYNMDVQGVESNAMNCWCQVVYPYVSEISYLQQIPGYLNNCIAQCSELCASNWARWMRNRPSPTFYFGMGME